MDSTPTNYALQPDSRLTSPQATYIIRRVLGLGGFGITYLADMQVGNIVIPEAVCIKEFFPRTLCERDGDTHTMSYSNPTRDQVERARRDFLGEARRLASLAAEKCSGIVTVNEVFETNNTAYYVMEYLRGCSLADFVKSNGVMTWTQVKALFDKLIAAVDFLHKNHVTHLDIKPANIMLVNKPEGMWPVLIDFGLSKHYNEDGSATSTINSQGFSDGYAPIEQYGGITQFSPASDVYAIGATMLFCLTGQRPEASTQAPDFADKIPGEVPQTDRDILLKALSLSVKSRYPDANALHQALFADGDSTQILTSATPSPLSPAAKTADKDATSLLNETEDNAPKDRLTLTTEDDDDSDAKHFHKKKKSRRKWLWLLLLIPIGIGAYFAWNELYGTSPVDTSSVKIFTVNGVSFNMVRVNGGRFTMVDSMNKVVGNMPNVELSDYYIGETEVTQELWTAVMGSNPSEHQSDTIGLPVENVSWYDVQEFIARLNDLTGKHFRLPTEAEWEFAARGGNLSQGYDYAGSNDCDTVAWNPENSDGHTHPVATKMPNELGIYDMSGNVWEWCQDWFAPYPAGDLYNPTGPTDDEAEIKERVRRGGCCFDYSYLGSVHARDCNRPKNGYAMTGFRLVLSDD